LYDESCTFTDEIDTYTLEKWHVDLPVLLLSVLPHHGQVQLSLHRHIQQLFFAVLTALSCSPGFKARNCCSATITAM
jgi:hypothetical protein